MGGNSKKATDYAATFGKHLKELRIGMSFSQKDIAEKIGVAVSTYANWEQGRREPCLNDIKKIICALEIEANELFSV